MENATSLISDPHVPNLVVQEPPKGIDKKCLAVEEPQAEQFRSFKNLDHSLKHHLWKVEDLCTLLIGEMELNHCKP